MPQENPESLYNNDKPQDIPNCRDAIVGTFSAMIERERIKLQENAKINEAVDKIERSNPCGRLSSIVRQAFGFGV